MMYASIAACPGRKVISGLKRRVFFAPKSDIAEWPSLPEVGDAKVTDMGSLATYVGSFKLKADAVFHFIDLKDNSSNVTYETAGELGSQIINNQATMVIAGSSKEIAGLARQVKNDDLVLIYQEKDGAFRVLGNKDISATDIKPSGDSGTEITAAKTSTFAVQVYDDCPAPYYEGVLPISATTQVNCKTGEEEAIEKA